jgi:YHS domain-containing protein
MINVLRFVTAISLVAVIFMAGCTSNSQKNSSSSLMSAGAAKTADSKDSPQNVPTNSIKDPVCSMTLDLKSANIEKTEYQGTTYYFCSEWCKKSFAENPEKYIRKSAEMSQSGIQ